MKKLTKIQQQHLLVLIERQKAAASTIAQFIEYLRDEHSAPEHEGWQIRDIQVGFEQMPKESDNG